MLIRVIRVVSVKSSIGIITHQGHISKVNENAHSLSDSVTLITSRATCDAKKTILIYLSLGVAFIPDDVVQLKIGCAYQ